MVDGCVVVFDSVVTAAVVVTTVASEIRKIDNIDSVEVITDGIFS